jgi:hypothetical protein
MQFRFQGASGSMTFSGPTTSRLLLVTDAGHDAVHVIDVAGRVHVGYVAAPGTITGPRGVAARGSLVAVSAFSEDSEEEPAMRKITRWSYDSPPGHEVRLFEGSGAMWTATRVVGGGFGAPGSADGQLHRPYGLRFTADGTGLAVADAYNDRVSVFRVEDGSFVRHVATVLGHPHDVEECEGGWLVACMGYHCIEFVGSDVGGGAGVVRASLGMAGRGDGEFIGPSALALVPGLGLVVQEAYSDGRLQFFATPDAIAMASMSPFRVAWLAAVARAVVRRRVTANQGAKPRRVRAKAGGGDV